MNARQKAKMLKKENAKLREENNNMLSLLRSTKYFDSIAREEIKPEKFMFRRIMRDKHEERYTKEIEAPRRLAEVIAPMLKFKQYVTERGIVLETVITVAQHPAWLKEVNDEEE